MTLTRDQEIKAIEELKNNEWVALGGLSPEAQKWAQEHKDEAIWFYINSLGNWHDWRNGICALSNQIYRLDPSYKLPEAETEPEYVEYSIDINKTDLNFYGDNDIGGKSVYNAQTPPLYINNFKYIFYGYKFESDNKPYNNYHGWQHNKDGGTIYPCKLSKDSKKVFANKIVYRKKTESEG